MKGVRSRLAQNSSSCISYFLCHVSCFAEVTTTSSLFWMHVCNGVFSSAPFFVSDEVGLNVCVYVLREVCILTVDMSPAHSLLSCLGEGSVTMCV